MSHRIFLLASCAGAMLLTAACGRSDDSVMSKSAPDAPSGQAVTIPAAPPVPASPAPTSAEPTLPKIGDPPAPMPGQAGDHSSPDFKDGGKAGPQK